MITSRISQEYLDALNALNALGSCPLCGSEQIELRWNDAADLTGYCPLCKEYFEVRA